MPEDRKVRRYRIGDYARKMGVTPDLLKHYEKLGLIRSETTGSGYRYYPFTESVPLLECRSLRNFGVPLQRMRDLLYRDSPDVCLKELEERAGSIRRNMLREQAMLEEYEALVKWEERMCRRSLYMLMEEREDMYFLPHSRRHDFLEDDRIRALLPAWMDWLPVVKSARRIIPRPSGGSLEDAVWGLCVPVSRARQVGLPLNGAVERLPGGRRLICHYRLPNEPRPGANRSWEMIREHVERGGTGVGGGAVLQVVIAALYSPDSGIRCGYYSIPVAEREDPLKGTGVYS